MSTVMLVKKDANGTSHVVQTVDIPGATVSVMEVTGEIAMFDETLKTLAAVNALAKKTTAKFGGVKHAGVQILDITTGVEYSSMLKCYRALEAEDTSTPTASELLTIAETGKRNSFGYYRLVKLFPGRFVENRD